jgi:hypothetical protein
MYSFLHLARILVARPSLTLTSPLGPGLAKAAYPAVRTPGPNLHTYTSEASRKAGLRASEARGEKGERKTHGPRNGTAVQ